MRVKEVMVEDLKALSPHDSAQEALAILFKMEISGLPVIDGKGNLLGMFTEKDVLSYVLPSYIHHVGKFVYEGNPKSTRKKFMDLHKIPVEKLMRREVVTVTEDATLSEVARIMLTQKARRLPVLDKSKKVVGIVARSDILRALAKEAEIAII
jgi:CBS domain-containing protein